MCTFDVTDSLMINWLTDQQQMKIIQKLRCNQSMKIEDEKAVIEKSFLDVVNKKILIMYQD